MAKVKKPFKRIESLVYKKRKNASDGFTHDVNLRKKKPRK